MQRFHLLKYDKRTPVKVRVEGGHSKRRKLTAAEGSLFIGVDIQSLFFGPNIKALRYPPVQQSTKELSLSRQLVLHVPVNNYRSGNGTLATN